MSKGQGDLQKILSRYIPQNDKYMKSHLADKKLIAKGKPTINSWENGQVLSAPLWIGYKHNNTASRIGISAPVIQSLTQNLVHKFMSTPYFIHYNNIKRGAFSYYGYYNRLTLWNN